MSKATITRLFIGSGVTILAGAIIGFVAVWLAIANNVFVMAGSDVVGVHGSALAWSLLGLGLVGGVAIAVGLIGSFATWIGALLNTWQLESKTWFIVLLVLGIFNLGFFAMVAYLIAGPDGTQRSIRHGAQVPAGA